MMTSARGDEKRCPALLLLLGAATVGRGVVVAVVRVEAATWCVSSLRAKAAKIEGAYWSG